MKTAILFLSIFLVCANLNSFAQLDSKAAKNFAFGKEMNDVSIAKNEKINESTLFEVQKINLRAYVLPSVSLSNIQSIKIDGSNVKDLSKIPTEFVPKVYLSKERKQAIAYVLIPQYKKNIDGSFEKLIKYDFNYKEDKTALNKTTGSRIYATNSVLGSGNFYKISIKKQGIYKIDYNFIKNKIGIDPSSFTSSNIRLYGNGGEMLAEDNAVFRQDDLVENAIQVIDGGDGKFDNGDYILFYANGPHSIVKDSLNKLFSHKYNLYNEASYYFLNFDLGAGKRISLENNPTTGNQTVTSYNDYQFHEQDSVNHGHYGKLWWGDEMSELPGRSLNKIFTFSFPDIDIATPITVSHTIGGIQHNAATSMTLTVNGNLFSSNYFIAFGYAFNDPVIDTKYESKKINVSSSTINLNYSFNNGGSDGAGYIDYIGINARRNLIFNGLLNFADWNSVGIGNIATYQIQNANGNTKIWDITNPLIPSFLNTTLNGTTLTFSQNAESLHRFIATDGSITESPSFVGKLNNQNLHNLTTKDYIIIAHPSMLTEANRLAQHHITKRNYKTLVVTPQEIYNEFSSGSQDICAIRDFVKMLYDKASINDDIPKYLLLFGDASYDYKDRLANNTNFVPTYETEQSISKILSYPTDDFFGFLDDEENLNDFTSNNQTSTIDIGVGRITAPTVSIARDVVTKIINYDSPKSFGPWKNNMTFNADDADDNGVKHLLNAEAVAAIASDSLPVYNANKIYIDAYVQESTPAGSRCPDANTAVREQMYNGTFLMNYNGHGGPHSWCEERIFTQNDINNLKNINKLPLFITATCDFAPFDNPADYSGGEILLSKPDGGAIALMTTTQLVYAYDNEVMNKNYLKKGFSIQQNGKYPTLGDAYRMSKNLRYVSGIDISSAANFRKFALLGDPGLPLAFPQFDVHTDSINGISVLVKYDTLKALNKYTISGHVSDKQGNLLSNFNGVVYPSIFDKLKKIITLPNGITSQDEFYVQNSTIYRGKATVKNGKFSFTCVVPKDINYEIGKGKISYYANTDLEDANGFDKEIYVGGSSSTAIPDYTGPIIKAYMNNEKFVEGGIVNANSTLLVKLTDDNGINYTGSSVGHDITAILDDNSQNTFVLNDFFEADLDNYRSGIVRFPINNLSEGTHTMTIKAWDILNNSAETKISFEVVNSTKGLIKNVYNYPNPFSTKTQFMFEHNMPNQDLFVSIQVLTMTGKVIKTLKQTINTEGTRINNINWDGLDEYGDKIGNGVYLYKVHIKTATGFSDTKLQKLVILN